MKITNLNCRWPTRFFLFFLMLLLCGCPESPPPPQNFTEAKWILQKFIWKDEPVTVYCGASYDENKNISLPEGFMSPVHENRAYRMEWEHAVPAENFGRAFAAWREGHPECVKNGKAYKGRRCAEKVSPVFRKMEADMYNLFPAIGAVNAARSNKAYAELPGYDSSFGSCGAKYDEKHFEPPRRAKGMVARASLYMEKQYREFRLSRQQRKLFTAWDLSYPPDKEECRRAARIEKIQGNENSVVKAACTRAGVAY